MVENTILLALKDVGELETVSGKLRDKGYGLVTAGDGARVMEQCLKNTPSFIIVDIELPVINGEKLFQILTNNPNTSNIPFLFLSDRDKEVEGFRIGKDIFLKRPYKPEELAAKLKQASLLTQEEMSSIGTKEIEGSLSQMSLADLLQILHLNKKEGELKIASEGSAGTVYIKDGNIYNAAVNQIEKEKALFRLLRWKEGTFAFHPQPVHCPRRIRLTTGNLLMEGMRQIDELEKAKHLYPSGSSFLKTRVDTSTLPKGLKPIIYEILFLLDFYQGTVDLVDHCSFPDYEVYSTILSLKNRGIIEEVKKATKGKDLSKELVTPTQAIKIKEKIISRWADMLSVNFGKIFIASASPEISKGFFYACKGLPGFIINPKIASSHNANGGHIGEMGALKLYGGLDVVFFSVPTSSSMGPLLKAFSTNLIGLVLLWDERSSEEIPHLVGTKKNILSQRRVPVLHIYGGARELDRELAASFKKALELKHDEPLFTIKGDDEVIVKIFRSFFDQLTKEDYVISGAFVL
jgi:CheY-like chemotaxis protein